MSSFRLTILGCGSALATINTHHAAHVLNVHEQFYLIDCGEGTQRQLLKAGIHPLKLKAIFISHLHGDHVYGLIPLLSSLALMGRRTPIKIFAPSPFEHMLEFYSKFIDEELPFEVQYHEVNTREHTMIYQNKVMEVWSIPLRHKLACSGFHFKEKSPERNVHKHKIDEYGLSLEDILALKRGEDIKGFTNSELTYLPYQARSYAYLSDTRYSAKAAGLIRGVDLLYHEATFCNEDKATAHKTGHSTASQAGKIATLSGAKKLIIGHLSPRYKDTSIVLAETREVFGNTHLAKELESYEIEG